ncbi:UNKNOWN [Stylonychia lemnae]|uniref:Uncharacterized protein n=1 Tax=Stylonychia lemnae TaxID=5949 RepID=A0A078ARG0_STYLE|nr:UNKNOWN [Stylonychia lemnae]|eukprot:CDW84566.1 UNKNOWN [Stylonychia lemnae]
MNNSDYGQTRAITNQSTQRKKRRNISSCTKNSIDQMKPLSVEDSQFHSAQALKQLKKSLSNILTITNQMKQSNNSNSSKRDITQQLIQRQASNSEMLSREGTKQQLFGNQIGIGKTINEEIQVKPKIQNMPLKKSQSTANINTNAMINNLFKKTNNNVLSMFHPKASQITANKQTIVSDYYDHIPNPLDTQSTFQMVQTPTNQNTNLRKSSIQILEIGNSDEKQNMHSTLSPTSNSKLKSLKKPLNFKDFYASFTLRKYKTNSDLIQQYQQNNQGSNKKQIRNSHSQSTLQQQSLMSKLPHLSQAQQDENDLEKKQVKEIQREIENYQQVAQSYKHLRKAFENENLITFLQKELELEDKRIKMLQRDPDLAKKLYPFNKRMGLVEFMDRNNVAGDSKEAAENSQLHIKINEKYFQKLLDKEDERVQRSQKFLKKNDYRVDFRKMRQAYEGRMWRKDLKDAMDMKKFVNENLNKNMMEQRWTLNLMRKRGKNPKNLMLIN